MPTIDFELILLTIERDLPVLSIGLPYICHFIKPSRVKIIASSICLEKARKLGLNKACVIPIDFMDEDSIVPGFNIALVRELIARRGGEATRAGWYFKQLLNLVFYLREDTTPFYLTWDADTIPVKKIEFFDKERRVCMTMKKEHHAPYFRTSMNLIGIGKVTDKSFIAEHMMFERDYVRALLRRIDGSENPTGDSIARRVIEAIDIEDLSGSGFAEYEVYGSFMFTTARERIALRELSSTRHGAAYFGREPSDLQLFALGKIFCWASFEAWNIGTYRAIAMRGLRRLVGLIWVTLAWIAYRKKFTTEKFE